MKAWILGFMSGLLLFIVLVVTLRCAGSPTPQPTEVIITPSDAEVDVAETQQFQASTIVTWSTTEGAIDNNGLYTAPDSEGDYIVRATSNSGKYAEARVIVRPRALRITTQPHDVTVTEGTTVTFSVVVASGYPPYIYQWYKSGTLVADATTASYSFKTVLEDNSSDVHVIVRDLRSQVTSNTVILTVQASNPNPPTPSGWMWGVTSDDPTVDTNLQIEALIQLPKRTTIRLVFDEGMAASYYQPSVQAISAVADIMGLTMDSSTFTSTSLATTKARMTEYVTGLYFWVDIWEMGNEVNGNWLGTGVITKLEAMYDIVKANSTAKTAITFYYENPPVPGYDMIPWIDKNIPVGHRFRSGLDYVLVSYYEDQNGNHQLTQSEVDEIFQELAQRFPNAKLGFGEFGWGTTIPTNTNTRATEINQFYSYQVPSVPAYIGGGFYWYFRQTMVPVNSPDWTSLKDLMNR